MQAHEWTDMRREQRERRESADVAGVTYPEGLEATFGVDFMLHGAHGRIMDMHHVDTSTLALAGRRLS
jgi:hypothetical protein